MTNTSIWSKNQTNYNFTAMKSEQLAVGNYSFPIQFLFPEGTPATFLYNSPKSWFKEKKVFIHHYVNIYVVEQETGHKFGSASVPIIIFNQDVGL